MTVGAKVPLELGTRAIVILRRNGLVVNPWPVCLAVRRCWVSQAINES
jgi:hypothetical protein